MKKLMLTACFLISSFSHAEEYAFSVSWQPTFCEQRTTKAECKAENSNSFGATSFTLHGLWPQSGQYCGISKQQKSTDKSKRWNELPEVALSTELRADLNKKMPGTLSFLDRHEWTTHGTCSNASQEAFFKSSLAVLDSVNNLQLRSLIAKNVGKTVTLDAITTSLNADLGAKGANAVDVLCSQIQGKPYLSEIRFYLTSDTLPTAISPSNLDAGSERRANDNQLCDAGDIYIDLAGVGK